MTKRIVLASNNPGKVREINQMLAGLHLTVVPQSDFEVTEVEETGLTFVENALLKARNAARCTGLPAIADDSGLEVDALHGAPGIYSARYAGQGAGDKANLLKLLEDIKNVPDEKRSARFQCVLVYLRHEADPTPIICQGTWEGRLLHARRWAITALVTTRSFSCRRTTARRRNCHRKPRTRFRTVDKRCANWWPRSARRIYNAPPPLIGVLESVHPSLV